MSGLLLCFTLAAVAVVSGIVGAFLGGAAVYAKTLRSMQGGVEEREPCQLCGELGCQGTVHRA